MEDCYAVAVLWWGTIVGHVPKIISAAYSLFLRRGGTMECTITGVQSYSGDLPQGGLEVQCELQFKRFTRCGETEEAFSTCGVQW